MTRPAHLELDRIVQRYETHTVVDGVSFRIETGSIACLLGPSGCGKTTLLRCIAGFEPIAEGEIRVTGISVTRPETCEVRVVWVVASTVASTGKVRSTGWGFTTTVGNSAANPALLASSAARRTRGKSKKR